MDNGQIATWRDHMPFDDISRRLLGWLAALAGGWEAVRGWIWAGCLVGAVAGLAFEPGRLLALAPIVCAVLMLLRSMLPAQPGVGTRRR
mgnify:CR=1 FL=1